MNWYYIRTRLGSSAIRLPKMPRVSIRRLFLYGVYTLVGASLVMLAFHVQQPWLRISPEATDQHPAAALQQLDMHTLLVQQQTDDLIATDYEQENVTSAFRRPDAFPWYLHSDGFRPSPVGRGVAATDVWPAANAGDRIEQQLMIGPSDQFSTPIKKIYLPNGLSSWQVKSGQRIFLDQKCPVNSCSLTGRRDEAATADAIMFKDFFSAPVHKRPANQIWIMYMLECPLHTQFIREKDVFNWTATYRHDSELVTPYEKWVYYDRRVRRKPVNRNYAANKTKTVAWFVSNCGAKNNRLEYAHNLQKHIDVDIYGSCGTKNCPRHSGDHCLEVLSKDYKFYLAFENSNCRDYITEKFYVNGLGTNVLPVVMGAPRVDYEKHAPEHSFIHVDDFSSPKELAEYLHVLNQNDTLYNQYFEWKETGQFINTYFFCRLCAMLHEAPKSQLRHYPDFNDWWRGGFSCIRGSWREYEEYQRNRKKNKGNKTDANETQELGTKTPVKP